MFAADTARPGGSRPSRPEQPDGVHRVDEGVDVDQVLQHGVSTGLAQGLGVDATRPDSAAVPGRGTLVVAEV